MLVLAAASWAGGIGFCQEGGKTAARVVKLTHLAVILSELDETSEMWDCEQLWTPSIEQVAAAEQAALARLREMAKAGAKVDLKADYVVQYYGIVLNKRKWIVCEFTDTRLLQQLGKTPDELASYLKALFAGHFYIYDEPLWFSALYDPAAKCLSKNIGDLTAAPSATQWADSSAAGSRGPKAAISREKRKEKEKPVARVAELTHLAVILPELEKVREKWNCERLWTPSIEQVAAAEKAALARLRENADVGARVDPKAKYIVQYYGIVLDKRKWIVCEFTDIAMLLRPGQTHKRFAAELRALFTTPMILYEKSFSFRFLYDPKTKRLSQTSNNPAGSRLLSGTQ